MATRPATGKDAERNQALLKRIKRVREIGTVIRSLNVYPTESQLATWISQMQSDQAEETRSYVSLNNFTRVLFPVISSNMFVRDDEERLYRAFQALDPEKRGYLLPDELRGFMTTQGECMTNEEVEEMLTACTDPAENKIYYEDFVVILGQ
eukprot:jgi/Hompol1/1179/HPOL_001479-RA